MFEHDHFVVLSLFVIFKKKIKLFSCKKKVEKVQTFNKSHMKK